MARSRGVRPKKPSARELQDLETYDALKDLLEERGWSVTVARQMEGVGGHCVVRGERRVILPSRLGCPDRIEHLATALASEDLEDVYVRPDLRELIEKSAQPQVGRSESGAAS